MNYLKLCLKLPNLGLVLYHLLFIIIIPYLFMYNKSSSSLKYYWPILVGLANILTLAGQPYMFNNLYVVKPTNKISFVSSNIINMVALMGIIWQCLDIAIINSIEEAILSGIILFICAFPLAREGIKSVVLYGDKLMSNYYEDNHTQHIIIWGLCAIIILIALETVLLKLASKSNIKLMVKKVIPKKSEENPSDVEFKDLNLNDVPKKLANSLEEKMEKGEKIKSDMVEKLKNSTKSDKEFLKQLETYNEEVSYKDGKKESSKLSGKKSKETGKSSNSQNVEKTKSRNLNRTSKNTTNSSKNNNNSSKNNVNKHNSTPVILPK